MVSSGCMECFDSHKCLIVNMSCAALSEQFRSGTCCMYYSMYDVCVGSVWYHRGGGQGTQGVRGGGEESTSTNSGVWFLNYQCMQQYYFQRKVFFATPCRTRHPPPPTPFGRLLELDQRKRVGDERKKWDRCWDHLVGSFPYKLERHHLMCLAVSHFPLEVSCEIAPRGVRLFARATVVVVVVVQTKVYHLSLSLIHVRDGKNQWLLEVSRQ